MENVYLKNLKKISQIVPIHSQLTAQLLQKKISALLKSDTSKKLLMPKVLKEINCKIELLE